MSVRTLRWVSVIVPTAFVVAFEIITRTVFADVVPSWVHVVVALAAVSLGAFLFSTFVFATIGRLERQVVERNRRLAILNALAAGATHPGCPWGGGGAPPPTPGIMGAAMNLETVGLALVSAEDGSLQL